MQLCETGNEQQAAHRNKAFRMKKFLVSFPIHLSPDHRLSLMTEYRESSVFDWEQQDDGCFIITPLRENQIQKFEDMLRNENFAHRLSYTVIE